jgi:ClpP class serine protease
MNANDDTPSSGESVSNGSNWESVGRELLQSEVEKASGEVWETYRLFAERVARGDRVDGEDLSELRDAHHQLTMVLELVEELAEEDVDE